MNYLNTAPLDSLETSSLRPADDKARSMVREISVFVLVLGGFVGMLSMLLLNG